MVVLTVVDRFFKMVHFVALPKLPSAKEPAEVLVNQVFKLQSFTGPQFTTKVVVL